MPEQLQPVIDFIVSSFQVDQSLLIQGVIIALILGFIMSGIGQVIWYTIAALVLDLIIVPLGMMIYNNDMNFGGAAEYGMEIIDGLMAADPMDIARRAVFFAITLIVVSLVKGVVRRS